MIEFMYILIGVTAANGLIYWIRYRFIQAKLLRMLACSDPLHRIAAVPRATLDATDNLIETLVASVIMITLATVAVLYDWPLSAVFGVAVGIMIAGFVVQRRWYRRRERELDLTGAP